MIESSNQAHPYDRVNLPNKGCLIFTPCPGTKGVDLNTSLSQLRQAGAEAIVTMMPDDELERFGVSDLPPLAEQQGMHWLHFPVEDDAAPQAVFDEAWRANKSLLVDMLKADQCIAIHCRGGSGRTGFMAALLMLEAGVELTQAMALVKAVRPNSLRLAEHVSYLSSCSDRMPV